MPDDTKPVEPSAPATGANPAATPQVKPVAGGDDFTDVASGVVARLLAEPRGVLTLLTGDEPPPLDGLLEQLASAHPELEIEVHEGGQPHYPLLLGAE